MRRFLLLTLLVGVVLVPTSCTMPEGASDGTAYGSYPQIVETDAGDTPMLQDQGSASDHVLRGTGYKD